MLNETNATLNAIDAGQATQLFFSIVIPEIFSRFLLFFTAPFIYPSVWWLLVHLVLTFVLFEFYFERHRGEELGWTAALANSIVMIFISSELLRKIYGYDMTPLQVIIELFRDIFSGADQRTLVVLIVLLGILGIVTAIINYFHFLPRRIAFLVSGHKTVNLLAYFLIVVVWNEKNGISVPLDFITLIALLLFGALMWLLLAIIALLRRP